jgi:AcrR family transcriptional regulator
MQKRALETKSKILAAARQEFSAKGFHGTTVDDISGRAGVNKQRIYAYFVNKENLFAEVLKDCYESIMTSEESFLALLEADIPHLAEILLRHYFLFHQSHPEFWRLIAWENLEGGAHLPVLKGLRNKTFQHLRKLYNKGQEQGIYSLKVSFETFIYTLSALAFFYFSNRLSMSLTLNQDLSSPEIQETLVRESLLMFRHEVRESSSAVSQS